MSGENRESMQNCPVCGSSDVAPKFHINRFRIHDCNACSLIFTSPLPTEEFLIKYYQGFMYGDGRSGEKPNKMEMEKQVRNRIKEIKSYLSRTSSFEQNSSRFLDYGGGTGSAFGAAMELGLDSYFLDLDDGAISHVKHTFRVSDERLLKSLKGFDRYFDFIWCDNVIEHVRRPEELLSHLYKSLKDGGVLIVKTPNSKNLGIYFSPAILFSYLANAYKGGGVKAVFESIIRPYWHCDPPRHLFGFSRKNMTKLAEKIEVDKSCLKYQYYDRGFWQNTFAQNALRRIRRPGGLSLVAIVVLCFLSIPELFLNLVRKILVQLSVIRPSGLVLLLKK